MKKFIYYIINYFSHNLERKIIRLLKKEKKLVIFDVGCFRGVFSRKIAHLIKNKKSKFYLFDVNKNTKKYISDLLLSKYFKFYEIALSNKNGRAEFNYNSFFESSGSSLSALFKNDTKWVSSRKLILKIFLQSTTDYIKYKVKTSTLDSFVKKNNIRTIDILKVDIEGSEYDFLKGAMKTLKKNIIKIVLIEISENKKKYDKKKIKIINFMKKKNFIFLKKHMNYSVSLFSNSKSGDYLFINNKVYKQ